MITRRDIIKTKPLVDTVRYAGLIAAPVKGSPIAILNKRSRPLVVDMPEEGTVSADTELSPLENSIMARSISVDQSGDESHSIELGAIVKYVSDKLSASIHYARNVVNPLVKHILVEAQAAQQAAAAGSELSRPTVMLEVPEIYYDGLLNSLLESYRSLPSTAVPLPVEMAEMLVTDLTNESFADAIKLNSEGTDAKILAAIGGRTPDKYTLSTGVDKTRGYSPYNSNDVLIAYLFLTAVKNGNVPAIDQSALDADERLAISQAINYFGFMVNKQIDDFDVLIKNNVLVDREMTSYEAIKVIGPVYRKWLAEGGTPEAVTGFAATNKDNLTHSNQQSLYTNPAFYKTVYDRVLRTETTTNRLLGNRAIDKTLKKELYRYIREAYSGDDQVNEKRSLLDKVESTLSGVSYTASQDLDMFILRNVCTVLCVTKNDAFDILCTMRQYLTDNPDSPPSVAALVAASKLTARWVIGQIEYLKR